ncbi:AraC family transcriptional regulator [Aquimarina sp. ERC-38]|uniref:helix-turn-helix domain-containing protein n=1 Tax=Aquimarina sp. ERC-38 TaxID=2949996 RepID=UPI0022469287|nr:AraC family transcriptional regulator [Aquimarina sp. ERC-38]UZO79387.1 AraC family transcriptional regulator [Aquimarina sp. ERC-38]
MIQYSFDFADIDALREYYRSELNADENADRIFFPESIADGYLSYYKISPEVFLLINNYVANTDIEYERKAIKEKDLILHFRKYAVSHDTNNGFLKSDYINDYTPGNMRCIDAQQGEKVFIPKGATVKSTMIVLKRSYTEAYLNQNKDIAQKVASYIKYSHEHINKLYFNYKQTKLFDQIVDPDLNRVEHQLYYISRGIRLLETFWRDVLLWDAGQNPFGIDSSQVNHIYKVTNFLDKNLKEAFVGVDKLASMAYMSRTNFFTIFKEIHNKTPLEYFNSKRLEKAFNLIFTNRMSVRDVMDELNYSNSSKFRKAFFNKFNMYPEIKE